MSTEIVPTERIARLEGEVRALRGVLAIGGAVLATLACVGMRSGGAQDSVLRVRGLVIEDAEGRARVVLGAPLPATPERKRVDEIVGLVLLGEDGADRLQLGHVGGPQMGGKVNPRVSPATGLMVNDPSGDERGGFGVFENGQAGWGLDYPGGGEAIVAAVMPDRKFAGIVVSADSDANAERVLLIAGDAQTTMELRDASGTPRARLALEGAGWPTLQVLGEHGDAKADLFEKSRP